MKKVTILAFQQSPATAITTIVDFFSFMSDGWHQAEIASHAAFEVNIVTLDGKPIRCSEYCEIIPHCSFEQIRNTDLIIIPSISSAIAHLATEFQKVIAWLRQQYNKGAEIAAMGTGSFLLAETGLLDGKSSTTHWLFKEDFQKRYPQVNLNAERLITEESGLYCSGGGNSGVDLCLHILEKYYDFEASLLLSKLLVLYRNNSSQMPYVVFNAQKNHQDPEILNAQKWIEKHYFKNFLMDDVATNVGMSLRNFKRRFKTATGDSPLVYLQRLRVEAAKSALAGTNTRIETIASQVGYEDIAFFRKIFSRYTGESPSGYRQRFKNGIANKEMLS